MQMTNSPYNWTQNLKIQSQTSFGLNLIIPQTDFECAICYNTFNIYQSEGCIVPLCCKSFPYCKLCISNLQDINCLCYKSALQKHTNPHTHIILTDYDLIEKKVIYCHICNQFIFKF